MSRSSFLLVMDFLSPRNSIKSSPDSSECMSDGMLKCYRVMWAVLPTENEEVHLRTCWYYPQFPQVLMCLRWDRGGISVWCVFCATFTHVQSSVRLCATWTWTLPSISHSYCRLKRRHFHVCISVTQRSFAQTSDRGTLSNGPSQGASLISFSTNKAKTPRQRN